MNAPRTLTESKAASPRYALSWRHRRALRLAEKPRLRKRVIDDEITHRAAKLYRLRNRLMEGHLTSEIEHRLRSADEDVFLSLALAKEPQFRLLKRSVMLRLLSGLSDEAVADESGLTPSLVAAFHDLHFWIRPHLGFSDSVIARIRGRTPGLGLSGFSDQQIQVFYAYVLGMGYTDWVIYAADHVSNLEQELCRATIRSRCDLIAGLANPLQEAATVAGSLGPKQFVREHDRAA